MKTTADEIHAANEIYAASFGDKKNLPHAPKRCIAIVTCMDCRLDPAKFAGLAEGDAHVIRNAGGRVTDDVIRSLLISYKVLHTREWFIIQHTDCGMQNFTNDEIRTRFDEAMSTGDDIACSSEAYYIDFMPISTSMDENLSRDIRRLRHHPLVPSGITIHGYLYDVHTGRLIPSEKAERLGAEKCKLR